MPLLSPFHVRRIHAAHARITRSVLGLAPAAALHVLEGDLRRESLRIFKSEDAFSGFLQRLPGDPAQRQRAVINVLAHLRVRAAPGTAREWLERGWCRLWAAAEPSFERAE